MIVWAGGLSEYRAAPVVFNGAGDNVLTELITCPLSH